jgi:phosphate transport system substrate-binding protein
VKAYLITTGTIFALMAVMLAVSLTMTAAVLTQEDKQEPPAESLSAEQVKNEIERLRRDIEAQRNSPKAPAAWKKMLTAEDGLEKARETRRQETDAIRDEIAKLSAFPDAVRWGEPIYKMENRLRELEIEDWKLTKNEGRRLFQARHAELSKLAPAETPELRSLGLDVLNYPRMDGSTSCQPLAALIACRCFGAPYAWVGKEQRRARDRFDDDTFNWAALLGLSEPELELLEFTLQARADGPAEHRLAVIINRLLAHNASTHQAYVNLIEGTSEIGLLARAPSPDELELARMQNIELDAVPCALDAFVFLVNTKNSVRNLTTAQIRDIYAGKIKNWNEVGGARGGITPYQREENSGSQQLMRDLVMKDVPFEKPKGEFAREPQLVGSLMSHVYLALTSDTKGLAYSVHYYERFMSGSPDTRTIAVDGVEPNFESIRQRKYPHTTDVFVVTRKGLDPTDPAARLRDWLRSPEGQSVVRESGYVPLPRGDRYFDPGRGRSN